MASNAVYLLVVVCLAFVSADEIDVELNRGTVVKFLRNAGSYLHQCISLAIQRGNAASILGSPCFEAKRLQKSMTNETQGADTLNLPANATSIRENITDTFSCENRTYGYYADVDNECQVFHVCLPLQTPSGRNVTYKWSFICPAETVFNQEVLVCTRPRESIPCEESPMYYDVNMEFGRVTEDKEETNDLKKETATVSHTKVKNNKRTQNRRPVNQKENIIAELLSVDDKVDKELNEMGYEEVDGEEIVPILVEETGPKVEDEDKIEMGDEDRLIEERSMKWNGKKLRRGVFRFKADI